MRAVERRNLRRLRERGAAMAELAIILPVVITVLLAVIDFGRLVYCHQVATDLTREAANLVSRGASVTDAWNATATADGPVQVDLAGKLIISTIRRKTATDPTPWIFEQSIQGPVLNIQSKIGGLNKKATIPHITSVATGVTITAVELYNGFDPIFASGDFALKFYPEFVYSIAFF